MKTRTTICQVWPVCFKILPAVCMIFVVLNFTNVIFMDMIFRIFAFIRQGICKDPVTRGSVRRKFLPGPVLLPASLALARVYLI